MAVIITTMWWQVVFQVSCLLLAGGSPVMKDTIFDPSLGVDCIDYSNERLATIMKEGLRSKTPLIRKTITKRSILDVPAQFMFNHRGTFRRMDSINIIDNLIPRGDYLVREHAKLVHDINSLSQVVFIRPSVDENKDYDDSIFHEVIETSTTSTARPFFSSSTASPSSISTKGSSLPVILVGGASRRQVVTSQQINFAKPTVSLIGTTISPVVKHPYPFVTYRKPIKICVTSVPPILTPRPPPVKTIWERLIDYFVPQRKFRR